MAEPAPIIFFSDAHFGSHDAAREDLKVRRFTSFLHHAAALHAEVFFLGDLFDFWFEYKNWIPKVRLPILSAIRQFTDTGLPFHLIVGNHDFWTDDYLTRELGVTLHADDLEVQRQGLRILISHGDGKAPSESGYRLLKRILRFRPNILFYRLLPADWAYALATFSSGRSREVSARKPLTSFPEYDRLAEAKLQDGFDAVIMGHLHHGWVRRLDNGWWINSGEFYERFTYVTLANGEFTLGEWGESSGASTRRIPDHAGQPNGPRPG